ncbi:MAG: cache domain-containing protein [Spirochaetota bacterium]|jgi:methyl-accepting chemotaxis protein|nr:cache domain-containing protein [Spirochaetota bacterium]
MRHISLHSKTMFRILISVAAVLALVGIFTLVSLSLINTSLTGEAKKHIRIIISDAFEQLEGLSAKVYKTLNDAPLLPAVAAVISQKDSKAAQTLGKTLMQKYAVDLITIIDRNGIVIGRGHSDRTGDDLTDQQSCREALLGDTTWGVETSAVVQFSLRGAAPVRVGGEIIGCVSAGVDLAPDTHEFAESVKRHSGAECTLFLDAMRVSTTITDSTGERILGTMLDDPEILRTVFSNGQNYFGDSIVSGARYTAAYYPLKNSSGRNSGMLSVAQKLPAFGALYFCAYCMLFAAACIGVGLIFIRRSGSQTAEE